MRVIAGAAKGHKLQTIEGLNTRPTTDRIKETLFNIIAFDLPESRFLDLFSGSGAIGIEALSRGADTAVFVEQAAECQKSKRMTKAAEPLSLNMQTVRGLHTVRWRQKAWRKKAIPLQKVRP